MAFPQVREPLPQASPHTSRAAFLERGSVLTAWTKAESLESARAASSLREHVDVVAVSLHKGMLFERATLAQSERPLSWTAIDAGADIVVGHHAHILRGIEVYKGKPSFTA